MTSVFRPIIRNTRSSNSTKDRSSTVGYIHLRKLLLFWAGSLYLRYRIGPLVKTVSVQRIRTNSYIRFSELDDRRQSQAERVLRWPANRVNAKAKYRSLLDVLSAKIACTLCIRLCLRLSLPPLFLFLYRFICKLALPLCVLSISTSVSVYISLLSLSLYSLSRQI